MYIPIILGTAREGRQSERVAQLIREEVAKREIETEIIDVRDYLIAKTENPDKEESAVRFREKISRADGLIIVSPEYNHGYPGELKLLLDQAYKEYARKPIGICGVSEGRWGGVRMMEQLRLVAIEFRMVPIKEALYFAEVEKLFDSEGTIKDPAYSERAKKFLDELQWYTQALKEARKKN